MAQLVPHFDPANTGRPSGRRSKARSAGLASEPQRATIGSTSVAQAYDQAGEDYTAYADGHGRDLFAFEGQHAYADRCLWTVLDAKLRVLKDFDCTSISILDAGCGPGIWLRRVVTRAHALGFKHIRAKGLDIARAQVQRARFLSRDLCKLPGLKLAFEVSDLSAPLPESDGAFDLALSLYCVLNHVPITALPAISDEIARVTSGYFITTVRPIGSPPTIFIDAIEKAKRFQLDHVTGFCEIEMADGRIMNLPAHLFGVEEIVGYFSKNFVIEEIRGLDLFHSRFANDSRWNEMHATSDAKPKAALIRLEETYNRDLCFVERASHLLLVAQKRVVAAIA